MLRHKEPQAILEVYSYASVTHANVKDRDNGNDNEQFDKGEFLCKRAIIVSHNTRKTVLPFRENGFNSIVVNIICTFGILSSPAFFNSAVIAPPRANPMFLAHIISPVPRASLLQYDRRNQLLRAAIAGLLSLPTVAAGGHVPADKVLGVLGAEGFPPERVSGWRWVPGADKSPQVFVGNLLTGENFCAR